MKESILLNTKMLRVEHHVVTGGRTPAPARAGSGRASSQATAKTVPSGSLVFTHSSSESLDLDRSLICGGGSGSAAFSGWNFTADPTSVSSAVELESSEEVRRGDAHRLNSRLSTHSTSSNIVDGLKFERYPQQFAREQGAYAHAAVGIGSDGVVAAGSGAQARVVEAVAGVKVIVSGGAASNHRIYRRVDTTKKMGSVSSDDFHSNLSNFNESDSASLAGVLRRSTSFLFQCFDPLSARADDELDHTLASRPPQPVVEYPDPLSYARPYDETPPPRRHPYTSSLVFEPYELGRGKGRPAVPVASMLPSAKAAALLVLPRSSSLTNSVLTSKLIVTKVFEFLQPSVAQKLSRVSKLWRSCAAVELARNIAIVELSWETSPTTLGKWSGGFIKDTEFEIDASVSMIQLRAWTFGTLCKSCTESFTNGTPFKSKANKKEPLPVTCIPVPEVSEITVTFPNTRLATVSGSLHSKSISTVTIPACVLAPQLHAVATAANVTSNGSTATQPNATVFSKSQTHFGIGKQQVSKGSAGLSCDVIFTKNVGVFFGMTRSEGVTNVEMLRLGALPASTLDENAVGCLSYDLSRVKQSITLYSRERWMDLMKFEAEMMGMSKTVIERGQKTPLQRCFDSCAVRNYLSCPEEERVLAFKQVLITLLSSSHDNLATGFNTVASAIAKLDKVAHRIEILLLLDVPYNQRRERLNEYYLDAWKAWMGLCIGEESRETDLMDAEEDDGLFEEIDLLVSGAEESAVRCPVGGGVSLRISGYTGSLKDHEAVYNHLKEVLLPEFSL
ncbi:hypothetical protein BC830DRAFT_1096405 [Chytriomyces sp. MP71]|nr:hypothetical protein BC830DRAFT_1096405 [Chytriomyces sp. MP71]